MLMTLAVRMLVLWLLGLATGTTFGGFILSTRLRWSSLDPWVGRVFPAAPGLLMALR